MKIYDVSMTIEPSMMVYNNLEAKKPIFTNSANFSHASHYETDLAMNLHTGTHIDAPLHMLEDGKTMDAYALEQFFRLARVIDLSQVEDMIHKEDLTDKNIKAGEFLLFKTRNSFEDSFNMAFISVADDGAAYLKEKGIAGVGIDALGIERSQPNHMTHKQLLGEGIPIIEGLRLKEVPEGSYQLVALPLKIAGVEAAPTRAILIEQ